MQATIRVEVMWERAGMLSDDTLLRGENYRKLSWFYGVYPALSQVALKKQ